MAPARSGRRRILRISSGAALTCALMGLSAPPGQAVLTYDAPSLTGFTLSPPDAYVTFRDNVRPNSDGEGEDGAVLVFLSEKDNPASTKTTIVKGVPGTGQVVVRNVSGVKPNTAYCVYLKSAILVDGRYTEHTPASITLCAGGRPGTGTESGVGSKTEDGTGVVTDEGTYSTDLSLRGITGDATGPVNGTRNYWLSYKNEGRTAAENVTLTVQTSGALSIRRPPDSGTFNKFTCTALGASGGATSGYKCTGGSLPAGASGQIPVLTTITKVGTGTIHVSIAYSNDPIPTNNSTTFTMQGQ